VDNRPASDLLGALKTALAGFASSPWNVRQIEYTPFHPRETEKLLRFYGLTIFAWVGNRRWTNENAGAEPIKDAVWPIEVWVFNRIGADAQDTGIDATNSLVKLMEAVASTLNNRLLVAVADGKAIPTPIRSREETGPMLLASGLLAGVWKGEVTVSYFPD